MFAEVPKGRSARATCQLGGLTTLVRLVALHSRGGPSTKIFLAPITALGNSAPHVPQRLGLVCHAHLPSALLYERQAILAVFALVGHLVHQVFHDMHTQATYLALFDARLNSRMRRIFERVERTRLVHHFDGQ